MSKELFVKKHKLFSSARKSYIISKNDTVNKSNDEINDDDDDISEGDEVNACENNEENRSNHSSDFSSLEDEETEENSSKKKATDSKAQVESDSDFDSPANFFLSSNCAKLPYTFQEDEAILKFILKGQNIYKTSSLSIWKHLESKKVKPKRTYQSLKNRFLRNIKPKIFSTFQHLLKDEQTIHKILKKFPELKKEYNKRNVIKQLNLNIEKRTSNSSEDEPSSSKKQCFANSQEHINAKTEGKQASFAPLKFSEPISDHVSDENTISKTVEFKNGEIVVTVKYNTSENTNSFKEQGIYEKYLRLKQKNVIVPCFHCGRGTSDLDRFEDGDSVSDNDTIIDSHEHNENDVSVKKSSKTKNKNDFFTLRKRKKVDESDVPKRTSTPKESEGRKEVEEQVNPAPDILPIVLKEEVSPKCSKPCGYHLRTGSKAYCSDEEINLLYRKIVKSCRTRTSSDESDECSDLKIKEKTCGNLISRLTASGNSETHLKNPKYSASSSGSFSSCVELSKKTNDPSPGISKNIVHNSKVSLFKNMVKMFGKNFRKKLIKSSLSEADVQKT